MMTPEWDDEEVKHETQQDFYSGYYTYPGASGTYSSSASFIPGSVTVTSDWIINTSHVVIKPNPALNTPVLEWDLSDASWGLTIKVILGIILCPILCVISKIAKKPIGIK